MASQKKTRSIKYKENTIHAETDSESFYNLCKTKNAIKTLNCKNDEKLKKILMTGNTGIFDDLRNTSSASSEPSVEACTKTPRSCTLIDSSTSANNWDSSSYEWTMTKLHSSSDFNDQIKVQSGKSAASWVWMLLPWQICYGRTYGLTTRKQCFQHHLQDRWTHKKNSSKYFTF